MFPSTAFMSLCANIKDYVSGWILISDPTIIKTKVITIKKLVDGSPKIKARVSQ